MAHRQRTPFTLKSGNKTPFRDMGSSPLKEPITLIVSGAIAAASAAASAAAAAKKKREDAKLRAENRASEATKKSGESKFASEETSTISEGTYGRS
jgi:succinate dehydrogenase/fumarate reductase flavoprotein subunit